MKRSIHSVVALMAFSACVSSLGSHERTSPVGPEHARPIAVATWLRTASSATPVATLEARSAGGETSALSLFALNVKVEPSADWAAIEVEHVFDNPSEDVLEGTFRFALPPEAVVTGLSMQIGGQWMEGAIVEREKARRVYQEIVDSMRDPAILEWEQGQTFKLRVFPIEAKSSKRIKLRYLAPTQVSARGGEREVWFTAGASKIGVPAPHVTAAIGDDPSRTLSAAADGSLKIAWPSESDAAGAWAECDASSCMVAVDVAPDWATLPSPTAERRSRTRVIVVDTSRSALEGRALTRSAVQHVLAGLGDEDRVLLIASDVTALAHTTAPEPATSAAKLRALAFLDQVQPDGASDLGLALRRAGEFVQGGSSRSEVVYVGDGTPTWGEIDRNRLREVVEESIGSGTFVAVGIGKSLDVAGLKRLTDAAGGRTFVPRSPEDLGSVSEFLDSVGQLRRLEDVEISFSEGEIAEDSIARTWFEGETQRVFVRLPRKRPVPLRYTLRARADGAEHHREVEISKIAKAGWVRELWAMKAIAALPADRAAEAIALSQEHGVLSRHTAFLVLENEEAYRAWDIEVTGLERSGDPELTPGDLQPGDPEIHIPAPADARSVTVVFPFGETEQAVWEPERGEWVVRFLVPLETPAGEYEVMIRVTHADGRIELLKAHYVIDETAPEINLELVVDPLKPGSWRVIARQAESDRIDLSRVAVLMPDGATLTLGRDRTGHFSARWSPVREPEFPMRVKAVATDRALNGRSQTIEVAGPGARP